MDRHHDALSATKWREARIDWHTERAQLQASLDMLHKTMHRLHTLRPEYLELIECALSNIQSVTALEHELNSFAIKLGFLPMTHRIFQWEVIQWRLSSTRKLRRVR